MNVFAERLTERSSSSSASKPSLMMPPSVRRKAGSSRMALSMSGGDVGGVVPAAADVREEARRERPERGLDRRELGQGPLQGDEVPGAGGAERDLAAEPLEVVDARDEVAELPPLDRPSEGLADGVEPVADGGGGGERPEEPGPEEAAAGRGHGEVDDVDERVLDPAVAEVADELQVADGRGVEGQAVAGMEIGDAVDEGQGVPADLLHIIKKGARGRDGPGLVGQAEAGERAGPEMLEEDVAGLGEVEEPGLGRAPGDRGQAVRGEDAAEGLLGALGIEDFLGAGLEHLVGEGFPLRPGALGRPHLAGDEVGQGQPPAVRTEVDGGDRQRFLGVVGLDLDGRARRQDLDDLPLDDALGRPRVLDLLADGDLVAEAEELREVGVDGVEGDAAHGDLLPGGQGQAEERGGRLGVLVEHLVEIAQPEEEEGVLVLRLDAEVLLHHRGQGGVVGHRRAPSLYRGPHLFSRREQLFGGGILSVRAKGLGDGLHSRVRFFTPSRSVLSRRLRNSLFMLQPAPARECHLSRAADCWLMLRHPRRPQERGPLLEDPLS